MSQSVKPLAGSRAFNNWYGHAAVRSFPRRLVDTDDEMKKSFFPERLIPHLGHPLVDPDDHSTRRYLAAQHLYQWLRFTNHFEVEVVCRATQIIVNGSAELNLSAASRMDAARIIVDESYHSLYNLDVLQQLEARSGIPELNYDYFGPFLAGVRSVGEDMPQYRTLIQLLQVVVFETLITSVLSDIPNDDTVIDIIRVTVRDHAVDEGPHHAFFASFFQHLWSQLDATERRQVARYLPHLITRSLEPPTGPAHAALLASGIPEASVREIVADSYSRDTVLASINRSAAKTMQLFARTGVMDIPGARDEFLAQGLVVP